MVTALDEMLDSAAALLASHHPLGASTGYLEPRGDWDALEAAATDISSFAVEFAALAEPEFDGLERWLQARDSSGFRYVSVHAPVKALRAPEAAVVKRLAALPAWVASIIVHPDVIEDPSLYKALGRRVVVENMDARKADGRTADELAPLFARLPAAGFCLDVAHVSSLDPSMALAHELLDRFGARLRQVHVSSLADGAHAPIAAEDVERFRPVLRRCVDVPWILEAPAA
jgi:hypothetical protein